MARRHRWSQARAAAGDAEIGIAGGASTIHQALRARVLDELTLDFVPIVLGHGERLFDEVPDLRFEPMEVAHSPFATHVRYRVLA